MTDALGNIIPQRWILPRLPIKYEQLIIVDWMVQEVDQHKIKTMPVLQELKGWRKREVITYIMGIDWTARIYQ